MGWYKRLKDICPEAVNGLFWKEKSLWKKNRPICGARCRDGHPCKAKVVVDSKTGKPLNKRCRMHGGLSTGPRTPEGKKRISEASRIRAIEYWKKKKGLEV